MSKQIKKLLSFGGISYDEYIKTKAVLLNNGGDSLWEGDATELSIGRHVEREEALSVDGNICMSIEYFGTLPNGFRLWRK